MTDNRPQKILVFQQNHSGEAKVRGIGQYGGQGFDLELIPVTGALPEFVEDPEKHLPKKIRADLVLDYLKHPDLSLELAHICRRNNVPVVASGKKWRLHGVMSPPTCCALPEDPGLGRYGQCFGTPKFELTLKGGAIEQCRVLRGAPCGATWQAAEQMSGVPVADACRSMGLISQFHCVADSAAWDPISGKSPVHIAAELHEAAMRKALKNSL